MKTLRLLLLAVAGLTATIVAAADRPPLRAVPHAPNNWASGTYQYDGSGNVKAIGSDVYLYDTAGRLVFATVAGVTQTYAYDSFGNRLPASATSPSTPCVSGVATPNCHQPYTIDPATNRLSSATYAGAGNVIANEGIAYAYDAAGMMKSEGAAGPGPRQYIYTASDERIAVYQSGTWEWSVRDESGKVLTEFRSQDAGASLGTANMQIVRDYIYRDNLLLASAAGNGPPDRHYHLDHLGTPRAITTPVGQRLGKYLCLPFGMELKVERTLAETPEDDRKFTGHERDIRSDGLSLDYMHARYYSPSMGRFLSVDPGRDWDMHQPQRWNMYAYVRNVPLTFADPNGRDSIFVLQTDGPRTGDVGHLSLLLQDETGNWYEYMQGTPDADGAALKALLGVAPAEAELRKVAGPSLSAADLASEYESRYGAITAILSTTSAEDAQIYAAAQDSVRQHEAGKSYALLWNNCGQASVDIMRSAGFSGVPSSPIPSFSFLNIRQWTKLVNAGLLPKTETLEHLKRQPW